MSWATVFNLTKRHLVSPAGAGGANRRDRCRDLSWREQSVGTLGEAMAPEHSSSQPDPDIGYQQEILRGRQFTLADVIGREGGSFLKGESPVPKLVQALTAIDNFIIHHLYDASGSLQAVLQEWVRSYDDRVSQHLNEPLRALEEILSTLLTNRELLYELVRQVDVKWGQMNGERPYFQRPGQTPDPEDEYTHESVAQRLQDLLAQVQIAQGTQ